MGEPTNDDSSPSSSIPTAPPPPPLPTKTQPLSLIKPSGKKKHKPPKVVRAFKNVFRSFPIIAPSSCKFPTSRLPEGKGSGDRVTGTLFGYRKGRVSLLVQENPKTLPSLVVELGMQTMVLQKEMGLGMVRIALECEKRGDKDKIGVMEEALWTMFCNGKMIGYGVKREATEEDLQVMEMLKAVSMGAGVLPGYTEVEGHDGEMAYIRAYFERVTGSKDSETLYMEGHDGEMAYIRAYFERVTGSKDSKTLYMLSPDGNTGPELSIFFVRV